MAENDIVREDIKTQLDRTWNNVKLPTGFIFHDSGIMDKKFIIGIWGRRDMPIKYRYIEDKIANTFTRYHSISMTKAEVKELNGEYLIFRNDVKIISDVKTYTGISSTDFSYDWNLIKKALLFICDYTGNKHLNADLYNCEEQRSALLIKINDIRVLIAPIEKVQ